VGSFDRNDEYMKIHEIVNIDVKNPTKCTYSLLQTTASSFEHETNAEPFIDAYPPSSTHHPTQLRRSDQRVHQSNFIIIHHQATSPSSAPAAQAGSTMPRRVWLKFLLALLLGFWFGLLLGFFSSFVMYYYLPQHWLENGFKDRRARHERFVERRTCRVRPSSCSPSPAAGK
jgi:hypothetical protein